MAYKSHGKQFYNNEDATVKSFDDKTMTLINEMNDSEIKLELKNTNCFKPMFAITVHKAQGMTINKPYNIYEYKRMRHNMLYVALTRTSKRKFVNVCGFEFMKPYTGYVYRYSHNNISYIGSTANIKEREEEHQNNKTNKSGRTIERIGYNKLQFEILETVHYTERTELYDIEDTYILKYDSINNGWNTRRNVSVKECV